MFRLNSMKSTNYATLSPVYNSHYKFDHYNINTSWLKKKIYTTMKIKCQKNKIDIDWKISKEDQIVEYIIR